MVKITFSDGLAVAGVILAIVLIVLDKGGKLRGPMLLVLLGVAAILTLPLPLSFGWVSDAKGLVRFSRGSFMLFIVGLIYSLIAVWVSSTPETLTERSAPPNDEKREASQPEGPIFREKVDVVSFQLGERGMSFSRPMAGLEKEPFHVVGFEQYNLVDMFASDGTLYANVTTYDDDGTPHRLLQANEFTINNPFIDRNYNDRAFEIVNQDGTPIFQFIYKTQAHVIVKGIFQIPGGLFLIGDSEIRRVQGHDIPVDFKTQRIFKYPSYKYFHQVESEETPSTNLPEAKSQPRPEFKDSGAQKFRNKKRLTATERERQRIDRDLRSKRP